MLGQLVDIETSDGIRLDGFLARSESNSLWMITHGVNGNFYGSRLLKEVSEWLFSAGFAILLVNTRGHDIAAFNAGSVPRRLGSQFETIESCLLDFNAWNSFVKGLGYELDGIAAHSLGAVKAAYWLANISPPASSRFLAISPPRLNTRLLENDVARGEIFKEHLAHARELCEKGHPEEVMKVRFPIPNWLAASTYLDKYGSLGKYDYFELLDSISSKTLWVFGENEVRDGSVNFRNVDNELGKIFGERSLFGHSVAVVPGADHSYRTTRSDLRIVIEEWLENIN